VHDFRPVNEHTIKSAYPYHNLDAELDALLIERPTTYSKTDAKNGYWVIPIRPGDEWMMAIRTPHGLYLYTDEWPKD
jgi:hypothetical protein